MKRVHPTPQEGQHELLSQAVSVFFLCPPLALTCSRERQTAGLLQLHPSTNLTSYAKLGFAPKTLNRILMIICNSVAQHMPDPITSLVISCEASHNVEIFD